MKRFFVYFVVSLMSSCLFAQSFEEVQKRMNEEWNNHIQKLDKEFRDYRDRLNAEYASYLDRTWDEYTSFTGIPRPKDELVPPVIYTEPIAEDVPEPQPVPYEDITPAPEPEPQPKPIAPVIENEESTITIEVSYYGLTLQFRHPKNIRLSLKNIEGKSLAAEWEKLAGDEFDNLMYDCLSAREQYNLCDWAYLDVLRLLAEACYGRSNEATLLLAFIYANSGCQMRLAATEKGELYMLYGSQYTIYELGYYDIDNTIFYPADKIEGAINVCSGKFEGERPLSLGIGQEQRFPDNTVSMPERRSSKYGLSATCKLNKNAIDFYNNYPTGACGGDFGTRWAMYANTPLEKSVQQSLYPALIQATRGLSQRDAVNKILHWVQTAFEYEYDDTVWGYDRAFFPSETLYYPYADCEDRSILFSRIVRDILHLDVVLLYYPGHLATAVGFTDPNVNGDYLYVGTRKFIVCDPTYINAPVGLTMPDMDNATAKVIMLNR